MGESPKSDEIEITPEMIEAGVFELRERTYGEDLATIARAVYLAMVIEKQVTP